MTPLPWEQRGSLEGRCLGGLLQRSGMISSSLAEVHKQLSGPTRSVIVSSTDPSLPGVAWLLPPARRAGQQLTKTQKVNLSFQLHPSAAPF